MSVDAYPVAPSILKMRWHLALRPARIIVAILLVLLILSFGSYLPIPANIAHSAHRISFGRIPNFSHHGEKLAYATYLAGTSKNPPPEDRDNFFVATRMLVYQILHDPVTKSQKGLPMIVLVDPLVTESKRQRLEKDGARVIPVEYLRPKTTWLKPLKPRWRDLMVKLRLWELQEYDRILFMDSDTMLARPMDDIFDEPGAQWQGSMNNTVADEGQLAPEYVMAGVLEVPRNHSYPPKEEDFFSLDIFNGGFFICAPSQRLFRHYKKILEIPQRFNSDLMEMALLNYAHRKDGPMPWGRLPNTWSIRNPNWRDVEGGVASVHEKWWKAQEFKLDWELGHWFREIGWKMQGFYFYTDWDSRSNKGRKSKRA